MSLNPLEQLSLVTIVAMAAIFVAAFAFLRRVLFLPVIDVMERRAAKLARARATYDAAKAVLARSREEAARIAAEADDDAARMMREVQDELARTREHEVAAAVADAEAIVAAGRDEVSRLRESERTRLAEQLLTCSRETLRKMIGEVDEEALRFTVSRALAARETG